MDPHLPSISSNNNDSDMAEFFNDPRFDNIPSDTYGTSVSFDRNPFLDTTNDILFEDALKPQFTHDDTTHLPSAFVRHAQLPGPSLYDEQQRYGSSTSARSSSNEPSPDSRSARHRTVTDSESPPAMTMRINPIANRPKPAAFDDVSMLNTSNPQPEQLPNWVFDDQVPGNFKSADSAQFDSVLSRTFGSNPSTFAPTPLLAANSQVFLTSPDDTLYRGDPMFDSMKATSTSRSNSQSTDKHASPRKAFASPVTAHTTANPSDLFPAGVWGSDNADWPDLDATLATGDTLGLTPSPRAAKNMSISSASTEMTDAFGSIPMHIAPIAAKSRVETQINIRMTLDYLPPGVTHVHLPAHTIAKSKLHCPDFQPSSETLEMHCMVVCTSAMRNPRIKQRALRKAAEQDNEAIQAAAKLRNHDASNAAELEEDQPLNGGGVRICNNCINRERKRAARKKLKKEEEQAHWERYETERIVVFNTHEHKGWQDWTKTEQPKSGDLPIGSIDLERPAPRAMQIIAPMRIACYCRHQSEKEGFQVIFTLKDVDGNVVSQGMTDSILLTDDHKTPAATAEDDMDVSMNMLVSSQSMINLPTRVQEFPTSKSTGNLTSLKNRATRQRQSLRSVDTSGTVTPRMLSRPPSPTGTHPGPAKKRKSTSGASRTHRRIASGLNMTRVEKPQQQRHSMISNGSGATFTSGPLTPLTGVTMSPSMGSPLSYAAMPAFTSAPLPPSHFHTQPPTPSESLGGFQTFEDLSRNHSLDNMNLGHMFSTPNNTAPNNTMERQQPRSPPQVKMTSLGSYGLPLDNNQPPSVPQMNASAPTAPQESNAPPAIDMSTWHGKLEEPTEGARINKLVPNAPPAIDMSTWHGKLEGPTEGPRIDKLVPNAGPTSGGIEVSVYGQNFRPGMTVLIDGMPCQTEYWAERCMCIILPRSVDEGTVSVSIDTTGQPMSFQGPGPQFRYLEADMNTMERALRFYSIDQDGKAGNWLETMHAAAEEWARKEVAGAASREAQTSGNLEMQGGLGR